jgi:hypothetical protein
MENNLRPCAATNFDSDEAIRRRRACEQVGVVMYQWDVDPTEHFFISRSPQLQTNADAYKYAMLEFTAEPRSREGPLRDPHDSRLNFPRAART